MLKDTKGGYYNMGIFTSKKNLQDLPTPSSLQFGSVKSISLPEIEEEMISSSLSQVKPLFDIPNEESKTKKQIFVKMEHYKEALDTIEKIREKIKEADVVLNDLRNMKQKEDEHLEKWHRNLNGIKDRLSRMDQVLYEIEHD